jgi:DNA-binding LacI/PurR family transcriptional regulator
LREDLRKAVRGGELTGKLPGERELARRYHANAKTINKALTDLTTEGLLIRHVGRGTFVAGEENSASSTGVGPRAFGWVGPGRGGASRAEDGFSLAEPIIRDRGHQLQAFTVQPGSHRELPDDALSAAGLRELGGLLVAGVHPSAAFLAHLNRWHLPVVLVGNGHPEVKVSAVLPDYAQGAFELCQHLVQLGHRDIRLLIDADLMPAAEAAEHGYRAALARSALPTLPADIRRDAREPGDVLRGATRPSALLCVGSILACHALEEAAKLGLMVGSQVSITALAEPGSTDLQSRGISAYETEQGRIIRWAAELLLSASPGQLPRTAIVPGRLIERLSTGPSTRARRTPQPPDEVVV